jgi:hypothetical protein
VGALVELFDLDVVTKRGFANKRQHPAWKRSGQNREQRDTLAAALESRIFKR